MRTILVSALAILCLGTSLSAQAVGSKSGLAGLRREVDSLKKLNDSLRTALRQRATSTASAEPSDKTQGASEAPTGPIVFRSGRWSVHRELDKMTDAPSCTGLYNNAWRIQLSAEGFYISFKGRGGVRSVTLRFGDEPARPLRLASDMEKDLSTVILQGDEFVSVLDAPRLRAQVMTILDNIIVEDVDLTGLRAARDFIATNTTCRTK